MIYFILFNMNQTFEIFEIILYFLIHFLILNTILNFSFN